MSASSITRPSSARCTSFWRPTASRSCIRSAARTGRASTNPWIRKYIFPGGYSPALSEVVPVIERTGLFITDVEILRLHYAETLKAWRTPLPRQPRRSPRSSTTSGSAACGSSISPASEIAFRYQGHMVFQVQMAKQVDAVPLTRDYITDWERSHAARRRRWTARSPEFNSRVPHDSQAARVAFILTRAHGEW